MGFAPRALGAKCAGSRILSNWRPLLCQGSQNSPQHVRTLLSIAFKRDIHASSVYWFGAECLILCSAKLAINLYVGVESPALISGSLKQHVITCLKV